MPNRHSVDAAIAWVDQAIRSLDAEDAPLRTASGRVLAADICAVELLPGRNRAALDGFAVQASASLGASPYNPIRLRLIPLAAGDALPDGTNAVVPLELAEPDGDAWIEILEAVAAGENVEQKGAIAPRGATLASAGMQLAAPHIGLLMMTGLSQVSVVRRPLVRVLVIEPTAARDSNGPMVCAAVERDGGIIGEYVATERYRDGISAALVVPGVDIVLVIGGTGPGSNDQAAAALTEAGKLAVHGVALHPGDTTGLGRTGAGMPVILLPGAPASCLWSYELFAGRAIRRLGGRRTELPYQSRQMITARKIVSSLGMAEICPVRCGSGNTVEPLPSFAEIGLMAAVDADGFVIVPQGSEGFPEGARVAVHLYGKC